MTQRNYLFGGTEHDAALTRLIATLASATGFLKGAPGGMLPGWYQLGQDNRLVLETLLSRLKETYPTARRPYYATRLWNGLNWQPAYIAFLSVHVHGAVPEFATMAQARGNLDMDGYRLQPGPQWSGTVEAMIQRAGGQLRDMGDAMLAEVNAVARLKPLPALRLLADRIVDLSARLSHFRPGTTPEEQRRICALWLGAMGLEGEGDLEIVDLGEGRRAALRARKGCCLDYLAMPGTYCSSCPKQDDDVRRGRLVANAIAEMDATE